MNKASCSGEARVDEVKSSRELNQTKTSASNLNANLSQPVEHEDEGKFSSDAIWLWVAIIATVCNIVVVAVVCVCAF
ncbi:hypothetical protein HF521_004044 [Silurus meridionalis]|uniref:Uncharacterized protein n=1 Tax=Silurus meridionalis TaxID=175797 RepID=A0A8T0B2T5_SILME|nr:hypothetical protein HF521_004044 [Silurus meridionalis]